MKRLILLASMFAAYDSFAAQASGQKENAESMKPWSTASVERLKKGMIWTLGEGRKVSDYQSNGVYKVCSSMHEQLNKAEPHTLPQFRLAMTFLKAIEGNEKYATALTVAKQKHKDALADDKLKADADKAWTSFRTSAAQVLAEHVEKQSQKFVFNRGQDKIKDLFTENADLVPTSQDAQNFEAATLALYGLMEVQENAKNEIK